MQRTIRFRIGLRGSIVWLLLILQTMIDSTSDARPPTQPRGFQRYHSILDAYARLICDSGTVQVNMHAVAKEAGASVGSLYHFFEGRDALLDGLGQRHIDRLGALVEDLNAMKADDWLGLDAGQVVERLAGTTLKYVVAHRDVYIVAKAMPHRSEFSGGIAAQIVDLYQRVLTVRLPGWDEARLRLTAKVLFKLPAGLVEEYNAERDPLLIDQALCALTAYLQLVERT